MKIPIPYFKNVPKFGDLFMDKIIVEYIYPLLSVLKDESGTRYLCMCYDTRGAQQWVVTPVATEDLIALLSNRLELLTPFLKKSDDTLFIKMDYQSREETYHFMGNTDIPFDCLPAKGELLDSEPDEWLAYIQELRTEKAFCVAEYISRFILESISNTFESGSSPTSNTLNRSHCEIDFNFDYVSERTQGYDQFDNMAA